YIHFDLATAGNFFLALNLGIFAATMVSRRLLSRLRSRRLLAGSCLLIGIGQLLLAAIQSPTLMLFPLILVGFAVGLLVPGVSLLVSDTMTAPCAVTVLSLAGLFFAAGSVSFTLLIWAAVHLLTAATMLILAAVFPLALAVSYFHWRMPPGAEPAPSHASLWEGLSPTGLLLCLALVVQSGSESAVGGWLALYWVHRLGVSLETALFALALYWAALALSKLLAPRLLWTGRLWRQLAVGTAASLFGCLLLLSTAGTGGGMVGALILGAGLGAVFPFTIRMIGQRLPYYHRGFLNDYFLLWLMGGLVAPWSIGHFAEAWGIEWALRTPAMAAILVFVLHFGLLLESRLSSRLPHRAPVSK
ncbi:MAG: MFS transporter, partial [Acidobacteria bacterium]|nr:MFS transporter [Acidobacteriota bacterium]